MSENKIIFTLTKLKRQFFKFDNITNQKKIKIIIF